jgi:hypothetical protein
LEGKNTRVVYSFPRKDADMRRIVNFALNDERTQSLIEKSNKAHKRSYLAHIVPSHHGMGRLIATADKTLRIPQRIDWDNMRFFIRLLVPFIGGNHHNQHCLLMGDIFPNQRLLVSGR